MAVGSRATGREAAASAAFAALTGVTSVLIILQGVWAGMFIREGKDNKQSWVEVHDWGARITFVVALIAAVVAVAFLRHHVALLVGAIVLVVLVFVEAYIGGLVGDNPAAETVHFPLAMALVGLSVWLPVRSRALRRGLG